MTVRKALGAAKAAPKCATCGTLASEATVLVAIPGGRKDVFLCDGCVEIAWDLVRRERKKGRK